MLKFLRKKFGIIFAFVFFCVYGMEIDLVGESGSGVVESVVMWNGNFYGI